jgi:archaemetzincin
VPIDLIALEDLNPRLLPKLAVRLARVFRSPCRIRPERLDGSFAYDARREQYHSTAILQALQSYVEGGRVLAVTTLDLYVPVLTFVFGEAQLSGNCAIVSLHRLREEAYGLPGDHALLEERLFKEAVHELGHTFGLRHCEDWRCVMTSSHAVEYLDIKSADLCVRCRKTVW